MFGVGNCHKNIRFETLGGTLEAFRTNDDFIGLVLPKNSPQPIDYTHLEGLLRMVVDLSLIEDVQFSSTTQKLIVRLEDSCNRDFLESLKPDIPRFMSEHDGQVRGIIVTVRGDRSTG